jgi:hypothetical protein
MTADERISNLESRLIANEIALRLAVAFLPKEAKQKIAAANTSAFERGLGTTMTDEQIEQISQLLKSFDS